MVLETIYYVDIITNNPTTGNVEDADAPPSIAVYEDDNDTAMYTTNSVKRSALTGNYRAKIEITAVNGFEIFKSYALIASASLGGVNGKIIVGNFIIQPIGGVILSTGYIQSSSQFNTILPDTASQNSRIYEGCKITIVAGTGAGQTRTIYNYKGGFRTVILKAPWITAPDNTSQYVINQ